MRIIKCDICKKEISHEKYTQQYLGGKPIDICLDCLDKYDAIEQEFHSAQLKLQNEYETKRRDLFKNIVQKNGLKYMD